MTDTTSDAMTTGLQLTSSEAELLRAALKLLIDTLGRDEADELAEAQAILARLPARAA